MRLWVLYGGSWEKLIYETCLDHLSPHLLVGFLQCKFSKRRENGPEFFYDPKYALRLCLKEKRTRACVHIYSMMSIHEEAVALALQMDPELAMAEADKEAICSSLEDYNKQIEQLKEEMMLLIRAR